MTSSTTGATASSRWPGKCFPGSSTLFLLYSKVGFRCWVRVDLGWGIWTGHARRYLEWLHVAHTFRGCELLNRTHWSSWQLSVSGLDTPRTPWFCKWSTIKICGCKSLIRVRWLLIPMAILWRGWKGGETTPNSAESGSLALKRSISFWSFKSMLLSKRLRINSMSFWSFKPLSERCWKLVREDDQRSNSRRARLFQPHPVSEHSRQSNPSIFAFSTKFKL